MAAIPGRIACPQCGENNFDTQAACWKCAAPLRGGAALQIPRPVAGGAPLSVTPAVAPVYASPAAPSVDPAVAVWAAVALAIVFPYVAVPVGIVFLMLDDRRKAEIGRVALLWGIVATIVQTLFAFLAVRQSVSQAAVLMQAFGRGLPTGGGSASAGEGTDLNAPAEPIRLPGDIALPESGGGVTFPEVPNAVRRP